MINTYQDTRLEHYLAKLSGNQRESAVLNSKGKLTPEEMSEWWVEDMGTAKHDIITLFSQMMDDVIGVDDAPLYHADGRKVQADNRIIRCQNFLRSQQRNRKDQIVKDLGAK